jgi:hypothetical protein
VSLVLIAINLPFMLDVERIGRKVWFSASAAGLSLWLYLGLLMALFFKTLENTQDASVPLGVAAGALLAIGLWLWMGGRYLLRYSRNMTPAVV